MRRIMKSASGWILLPPALAALFLATTCPSFYWDDCGEFVVAAHGLGVLHAPGHPLFPLVGRCAALLEGGAHPVFGINLLSAIAAAAGLLFFYATGVRFAAFAEVARESEGARGTATVVKARGYRGWRIPGMCLLTLIMATRGFVWGYATQAEIYSLLFLFSSMVVFAAARSASGAGACNLFVLTAYLFGLGVTANPMVLFMLPVVAVSTMSGQGRGSLRKGTPYILLFFLLGLSIYLYCPLRSIFAPPVNWGETHRFHNLVALLTLRDFSGNIASLTYMAAASFSGALAATARVFFSQFPPILIPFCLAGLIALARMSRGLAATAVATCCGNLLFASVVGGGLVHDAYLIPALYLCFVLCALGIAVVPVVLPGSFRIPPVIASLGMILLLGGTVLFSFACGLPRYDRHDFRDAEIYGKFLLQGLDGRGVLCTENTMDWFSTMAVQYFQRWREDVSVLYIPLLERRWYRESLERRLSLVPAGHRESAVDGRVDPLEILFRLKDANPGRTWYYTPREHILIPQDSLVLDGPVFRIVSSEERSEKIVRPHGDRDPPLTTLSTLAQGTSDRNTKKRIALIHQYRGSFMYSQGRLTNALPEYRTIIHLLPGNPDAWYNLGLIADRSGERGEALAALEEASRLEPANIRYRRALGESYLRIGDYSAAFRELSAAIEGGAGEDYRIHRHRAISLLGLKRIPEAKEAAHRAVSLKPDDSQALNGLGLCFLREGRGDSARHYFRRAVVADSSKAGLYGNWMLSCEMDSCYAVRDSLARIIAQRFGEQNPLPWAVGEVESRFVR